jgi:hypothetical protein
MVWAVTVVVALEFAGAVALVALLILDVLVLPATSVPAALALVVMAGVLAAALGAVLVGLWRARPFARALGIVFQMLFIAIGIGALQGAFAAPEWGWPLVAVGSVGFLLFMTPPVAAWLSRRDGAS